MTDKTKKILIETGETGLAALAVGVVVGTFTYLMIKWQKCEDEAKYQAAMRAIERDNHRNELHYLEQLHNNEVQIAVLECHNDNLREQLSKMTTDDAE